MIDFLGDSIDIHPVFQKFPNECCSRGVRGYFKAQVNFFCILIQNFIDGFWIERLIEISWICRVFGWLKKPVIILMFTILLCHPLHIFKDCFYCVWMQDFMANLATCTFKMQKRVLIDFFEVFSFYIKNLTLA